MRTPNPSQAEITASVSAVVPCLPAIVAELLARLRVDYPTSAAAINEVMGWTGARAIKVPRGEDDYRLAPAFLIDNFTRSVLVGCDLHLDTNGIRTFGGTSTLQVFVVDEVFKGDYDLLRAWGASTALIGALFPYLNGVCNADGVRLWWQLIPQSVTGMPEEFAGTNGGFVVTYQLETQPQAAGWPLSVSGVL